MGVTAPMYTYRSQLYQGVSVMYVKRGFKPDLAIVLGSEAEQKALLLSRGSIVNKVRAHDVAFVEFGYLFDSFVNEKGLISLTKSQAGEKFDSAMLVFRKPDNYNEGITYELTDGSKLEVVLSGFRGKFNEALLVLPINKILKVSMNKNHKPLNLYFYFDGYILKKLNRFERFLLKLRGNLSE